jgi:hypothetical protein
MTRDSQNTHSNQTPTQIKIEAVQVLSFSQFVHLTRHYVEAISKYVPDAADWIQTASLPWHEQWDAVVSPNGEYVGLDHASALRQFDWLERFGADMCDGIQRFYSEADTNAIRIAFEDGVRNNRLLYMKRYAELEAIFSGLADKMINVLLDGLTGVTSKAEALAELNRIADSYGPRE